MCDHYIKHPLEVVSVGDIVDVKVLDVDLEKARISLTMKLNEEGSEKKTEKKASGKKDSQNKRPNGNNKQKPKKKPERKQEYAPGTIGYILAHQNRK